MIFGNSSLTPGLSQCSGNLLNVSESLAMYTESRINQASYSKMITEVRLDGTLEDERR